MSAARRGSLLHRGLAMLMVFALTLVSFEAQLADVHDGDAAVTASANGDERTLSAEVVAECQLADDPVPSRSTQRLDAPHCQSDGHSHHPVHVCHCTHAHGAAIGHPPQIELSVRLIAGAPMPSRVRMPESAEIARSLRPPVELTAI